VHKLPGLEQPRTLFTRWGRPVDRSRPWPGLVPDGAIQTVTVPAASATAVAEIVWNLGPLVDDFDARHTAAAAWILGRAHESYSIRDVSVALTPALLFGSAETVSAAHGAVQCGARSLGSSLSSFQPVLGLDTLDCFSFATSVIFASAQRYLQ
jgi:hypothetical protein